MKKLFRRYLSNHSGKPQIPWMARLGPRLSHPGLWHLNRHTVAGGVAAGLFCGLIPGPFQMLGAACCAIVFRVNLPLALAVTLYTNPLTIIPLYWLAFQIGLFFTGPVQTFTPPPAFSWQTFFPWIQEMGAWVLGLGKPLGLGLVLLASGLALLGYFGIHLIWRLHTLYAWRQRQKNRNR